MNIREKLRNLTVDECIELNTYELIEVMPVKWIIKNKNSLLLQYNKSKFHYKKGNELLAFEMMHKYYIVQHDVDNKKCEIIRVKKIIR